MCVYYMTGTPEGSTESGFMEKPGIEPATPGLQGIALIHYTTGASQQWYSKIVILCNAPPTLTANKKLNDLKTINIYIFNGVAFNPCRLETLKQILLQG